MKYSENLLNIGLISKKRSYNLQKKPVGVPFIAVKTSKSRRRYSSCYVCSLIRKLYFLRINILLGKNRKKQKWGCCIQRRPQKSIVIIKIGISIILRFLLQKNLPPDVPLYAFGQGQTRLKPHLTLVFPSCI